ncbi:MAG: FAD-dependent oxidoreductase [Candidatus Nanoarchaeia archaeon]
MFQFLDISEHVSVLRNLRPNETVYDIFVKTENGTTYNTYVIKSNEGYALVDPGRLNGAKEMVEELSKYIDMNKLTHIIITQSQPSHSEALSYLLELNPELIVVGTLGAMTFLKHVINTSFKNFEARANEILTLGDVTIKFTLAPNLPWPDAMLPLVCPDLVLLSGGVFSAHYCSQEVFRDEVREPEKYEHALYQQYSCIFHPHNNFVHKVMEKVVEQDIQILAPSFGPINRIEPKQIINSYLDWSSVEQVEKKKVAVVYVSAHGYTHYMAKRIAAQLEEAEFIPKLVDITYESQSKALHEINTAGAYLIGSPTIACDAVPPIWNVLTHLLSYNCEHKLAAAFGSFGWTGEAVNHIESRLTQLKSDVFRPGLKIRLSPHSSEKEQEIDNFAQGFIQKLLSKQNEAPTFSSTAKKTGYWQCLVCGEITQAEEKNDPCAYCRSPGVHAVVYEPVEVSYKSDSNESIIIIGSGVAAVNAAQAIRARNTNCSVEIISADDILPYYRILLSKRLHCQNAFTHIKEQEWFDENNIILTLNTKVKTINTQEQEVVLEDNSTKHYDKLIIATGAKSRKIPIHGDDKRGVFDLRGQEDFDAIREYAQQDWVEEVTIIGGGILALEASQSLTTLGKKVTIVECAPRLMFKQLDTDASTILQNHLENQGLTIYTNEITEEIYGTGEDLNTVCGVKLAHSKKTITSQMVLRMVGISLNTDLVKNTPIELDRGILVNDSMQTSVENVYAVGDVAQWSGKLGGIWSIAKEQGAVAGANAVGDNSITYREVPTSFNYTGFNYELFSIGDIGEKQDMHYQILELADQEREVYRRLYFHKNQFVGGILLGDTSKAPFLRKAIIKGSSMQDLLEQHYLDE